MSNIPLTAVTTPGRTTTFRDSWQNLSPPWLQGSYGLRFGYVLGIEYDGLWDSMAYALRFRFPNFAPTDAFPWLAADRQIDRGENESYNSYGIRLTQWLDLWRGAGGANAIMLAISSYLGIPGLVMEHVKQSRTTPDAYSSPDLSDWDVWDGFSTTTNYHETPHNWDWDSNQKDPADQRFDQVSVLTGLAPGWWRTWVILYGSSKWTQSQTFGDGSKFGDGKTFGSTATAAEVSSIKNQVSKWKSAVSLVQWIIVAFDSTWFQYNLPQGSAKLPDGTWGQWGKVVIQNGVRTYVPSRTSTAIYFDGVG